jgi:adenylate kinase family enzyme
MEYSVGRLLERGKDSGRSDDNIETIRKRFKTHQESAVPIIDYFKQKGTPVHKIDSAKSVIQVYASVLPLFK